MTSSGRVRVLKERSNSISNLQKDIIPVLLRSEKHAHDLGDIAGNYHKTDRQIEHQLAFLVNPLTETSIN